MGRSVGFPLTRVGGAHGGGAGPIVALGVQFTAGKYALGTAGQFANAYRRLRVCWCPDAQPGTAFSFVCGIDTGAGGSIMLGSEERLGGVYAMGGVMGFDGVYSTTAPGHIVTTGELGRYVVDDVWTDGTYMYHARNGRLVKTRVADADVSWTSAFAFAINSRPTAAGTLQWGSITVFDIQLSTTVPASIATVRADAQLLPGVAVTGTLNHWVMSDATSTTVTDRVSSRVLTFTGSPTIGVRKAVYRQASGQTCYIGDSNVMRMEGGTTGNGPRKIFDATLIAAGYATSQNGKYTYGAATTKDFDGRNSGLSGQALDVDNGAVPKLTTSLAADLTSYVAPDGTVVLMYGTNDGYVYCNTPGGNSGAAGAALFITALETVVGTIGTYLDAGRPIVVTTPLRVATGSTTAAQRDFYPAVYALLPACIAGLQATYPGVELADTYALLTPTQADADNVAILPDGTHVADSLQATVAAVQSAAALTALARAPA